MIQSIIENSKLKTAEEVFLHAVPLLAGVYACEREGFQATPETGNHKGGHKHVGGESTPEAETLSGIFMYKSFWYPVQAIIVAGKLQSVNNALEQALDWYYRLLTSSNAALTHSQYPDLRQPIDPHKPQFNKNVSMPKIHADLKRLRGNGRTTFLQTIIKEK